MKPHPIPADQPHVLIGDAFRQDPFTVYDALRADGPVVRIGESGSWAVVGNAEAQAVLKDNVRFSSDRLEVARRRMTAPHLKPLLTTISKLMLQRDEPDHRVLRKLVHYAFERAAVERYEPHIRELAQSLLERPSATGKMDFIADFAVPLPILVISEIVGIPTEDRHKVKGWCDAFSIVVLNFYTKVSDEELDAGNRAIVEFNDYLRARVAELEKAPDDSLLSALIAAEADGERLTFDDLLANSLLLLNAGNETTTILLANACHQLITDGLMPELRADPSRIPDAIEESLRHDAPVHFIGRIATEAVKLGGVEIAEGDLVLLMLASAGRDPAHAADPNKFVMGRSPNRHLAFGSGPHMCSGLQLARLEAQVAFEVLLDTFSDIALTGEPLTLGPNMNLRCFERLPLNVTARARA